MIIGCLGKVVFEVGSRRTVTTQKATWKSRAKYASHSIHSMTERTEFIGLEADKMSLEIKLSKYWGADVMGDIEELFRMEREAEPVDLVIGNHAYGREKWVITDQIRNLTRFDGRGNLTEAEITIELAAHIDRESEATY